MQFGNMIGDWAKFKQITTGFLTSAAKLVLRAPSYIQHDAPAVMVACVLDVQVDNTLDPGGAPTTGDRYIITDAGNLNANFGVVAGLENGDIIEYDGAAFIVVLDVSAGIGTGQRAVTYVLSTEEARVYNKNDGGTWGLSNLKVITFYVDSLDPTQTFQTGDSFWSDGVTPPDEAPSGVYPFLTQRVLDKTAIIVPGGTVLTDYKIVDIAGEFYFPVSLSGVTQGHWNESPVVYGGTNSYGYTATNDDANQKIRQYVPRFQATAAAVQVNSSGCTQASVVTMHARVRVACVK